VSRQETIFALATGAGRAGVAVFRLSGPYAAGALETLSRRPTPAPRVAVLRRLLDADAAPLDDALALWFPGPASFTGEDVVELHVHGGPAVIAAVASALSELPGLRLARPGEFTRRAFDNGKLDLTEAEGLADLIEAETEGQRQQALRQMEGALGRLYEDWRARLIQALALLEAAIDFPDEDLPADLARRVDPMLASLFADLHAHLHDKFRGQRVRDGYRIAIIGAPNAGKSSILNSLASREAAIVSDFPGTTRDVIEVRLTLAGFPVLFADTAGLRTARDAIEAEGVRRAFERAEDADLRLLVLAPDGGETPKQLSDLARDGDMVVLSKCDLDTHETETHARALRAAAHLSVHRVSSRTHAGMDALLTAIETRVAKDLETTEAPPLTRSRHREHLLVAYAAIDRARDALARAPELAAEDLRSAGQSLARITGRFDVELILDAIFSQFCIGK
jgi:tRNA modification GTPase